MLVKGKAEYVAGGWPGERYTGEKELSVNVEEDATLDEIKEKLTDRIRTTVATGYCMKPGQIEVRNLVIL